MQQKQNDTIRTGTITYRWDGEQLFITSGPQQMIIKAADLLPLADLLYHHKEEIFRHAQDLPEWVKGAPTPPPDTLQPSKLRAIAAAQEERENVPEAALPPLSELLRQLGVHGTVTTYEGGIYVNETFLMRQEDLPSPSTADNVRKELQVRAKQRGLLP